MSLLHTTQPLRLYQFDRSAAVVWRYTSADRKITHLAQDWQPQPISDNGVRMTGEASADTLEIVVPASLPVAQLFRATPPSEEVFVTIYDYDAGEQDADVCWVGSVSAARFDGPGQAMLICDSLSTSMRREGLRLSYERSCPHSVYDGQCGVDVVVCHEYSSDPFYFCVLMGCCFISPSAGMPDEATLQAELEKAQKNVAKGNEKNKKQQPLPTM